MIRRREEWEWKIIGEEYVQAMRDVLAENGISGIRVERTE
jgi:hypothetical protein